jgi:hypothetical protein
MPVSASDLVYYQAANHPEDDTSTVGGGINTAGIVVFTDVASPIGLTVISDGADTRQITLVGRATTGVILQETLTLNGTTRVAGANTYERFLKATLSAANASRTVLIDRNDSPTFTNVATLGPNITSVRRLFIGAFSESTAKTYYEKFFIKNNNASLALLSAKVRLTSDPSGKIAIGLATAKNDTGTTANRLTAPSGVTFVGLNTDIAVPGNDLGPGEAIGVWVRLSLAANDAPAKITFEVQISGQST